MGNAQLGLIGGILQGIGQGRQAAIGRTEKAEHQKLVNQMLKLQMAQVKANQDAMKMKQEQQARAWEVLQPWLGQAQAPQDPTGGMGTQQGTSTPIMDSQAPGGVIDMMAGGGPGGHSQPPAVGQGLQDMPPMIGAVLEKLTGFDVTGAMGIQDRRYQDTQRNQQWQQNFNRGNTEYNTVEVTNPDGSKSIKYLPKYGMPKQGQTGDQGIATSPQLSGNGTIMTAPPPVEKFEYEEGGIRYSVIRNKQTGQNMTSPVPVSEKKGPAAETGGKIALAMTAVPMIDELEKMFIGPDGKINEKLVWMANAPMGGFGEGRQALALFNDAVDARVRAATGAAVTADEQVAYRGMYFPHPMDSQKLVRNKLERLRGFMDSYLKTMDPSGTIRKSMSQEPLDTSGMKTYELPPKIKSKLKEGVATTLSDGSVWTLLNGEPARVR